MVSEPAGQVIGPVTEQANESETVPPAPIVPDSWLK